MTSFEKRALLTILLVCVGTSSGAILPARPQLFGHFFTVTGPGEVEVRIAEKELPPIMATISDTVPTLCAFDGRDLKSAMRKAEATIWPEFADPAIALAPMALNGVVEGSKTYKTYTIVQNLLGASKITLVSLATGERLGWATLTYRDRSVTKDGVTTEDLSCAFDEFPGDVTNLDQQIQNSLGDRLQIHLAPDNSWWRTWSLAPSPNSSDRSDRSQTLSLGGDPSTKLGHVDLSVYETVSPASRDRSG